MNLYLLMGQQNTRKSSCIRTLTGIGKSCMCDIKLADGGELDIFANIQALQEKKISPDEFISVVKEGNYSNVLTPLRIHPANGCPNGKEYIERFLAEGWHIRPIFVLGTDRLPYQLSKVKIEFIIDPLRPNSQNAKDIKKVWI